MSTTSTKTLAKKPIFRKSLPGGLSAAVFENEDEGRTYRSVNFQRSYRKKGEWVRSSMYLDHDQIPFAIEILQGTLEFLNNGYGALTDTSAEPQESDPVAVDDAEVSESVIACCSQFVGGSTNAPNRNR